MLASLECKTSSTNSPPQENGHLHLMANENCLDSSLSSSNSQDNLIDQNSIIIDPEFQSLIPPPSPEERSQLENNLIAEGCRDALVLWAGHRILLDGHNRYSLCLKHDIAFRTKEVVLEDREAAWNWIVDNQLGRRNATPEAQSYLRGKRYNREKTLGHGAKSARHNDGQITAARLAEEYRQNTEPCHNHLTNVPAVGVEYFLSTICHQQN